MRRLIALAGATAILACHDFGPDGLPGDGKPLDPPTYYARWYALAEQCTGATGDYARVRWYTFGLETVVDGEVANGLTNPRTHQIGLALHAADDSTTVIHESMHDILHTGEHPLEYFGVDVPRLSVEADFGKCGHLIRRLTRP